MARIIPTLEEAEAYALTQSVTFDNPDVALQGRYKMALGLPLTATLSYDILMKLVEVVCELDQRIEVLETP